MASLHPDFEYDIFISYRQNDNKRDGWVTRFVAALQDELDATLKNPVSIYFDENPHDGLLESHQVKESLDVKLKCLVFIPILSQTYCDTKSFAWNHEFLPFKQMAKADSLGLNVRLKNGNISSRILPVRIHDLDPEDENLLENELGGPVRSIDFVYSEPGVNRELNPDDNPDKNLNGTLYRNQINKVANALKEIGNAILNPAEPKVAPGSQQPKQKPKKPRHWPIVAAIIAIAIMLGGYFYFAEDTETTERDMSLAVMAFTDNSPTADQEWLGNGIAESVINELNNIEGLKIIGKRSSFSFKEQSATSREIGEQLQVSFILEGSVSKVDDRLRVNVELIDTESEVQFWNKQYDLEWGDVHEVMDDVTKNIVQSIIRDFPQAGLVYKKSSRDIDPKAYEYYLKGLHYHWEKYIIYYHEEDFIESEKNFLRALEIDPDYIEAIAGLADLYDTRQDHDDNATYKFKRDSLIALGYTFDPTSAYLLAIKGFSMGTSDLDSAFYYLKEAYRLDPENIQILTLVQNAYGSIGLYYEENKISRHILSKDPLNQVALNNLAGNLMAIGKVEEGKAVLDELLRQDPDNRWGNQILFNYHFVYKKNYKAAREVIDRFEKIYPGENDRQWALLLAAEGKEEEALALSQQIDIYCLLGLKTEALKKLAENETNPEFIMGWNYLGIKNYSPIDLIRQESEYIKFEKAAKARYEERVSKYGGVFQEDS